jgi:hypothetical protein
MLNASCYLHKLNLEGFGTTKHHRFPVLLVVLTSIIDGCQTQRLKRLNGNHPSVSLKNMKDVGMELWLKPVSAIDGVF